jgi:ABC-type phosphate/phosphonate transport system substrate-binding protein
VIMVMAARRMITWVPALVGVCPVKVGFATLVVLLAVFSPPVSASSDDGISRTLRTGYLSRVFHDIDIRDARAATELLAKEMSSSMGFNSNPKVSIYYDAGAMAAAVVRGELDLVSMPTIDYLRMRGSVPLIPAFVGAHNNGMGSRYVLIVRRDGGIGTIAELKGKSISVLPLSKHEPSHIWLEVQLMKAGKAVSERFFSRVRESAKVSNAIMGVFFRQSDAAIVTRAGFDASCLLNPQMGRDLVVIAESGNFSDGVTCFPANITDRMRSILTRGARELNQSTKGRQLYTIYQTTGSTAFKPAYLEGLEELLRERDRLTAKRSRRK